MNIRIAALKDAEAFSQIYAPFIQTTITFETKAPDALEFTQRISDTFTHYPWIVVENQNEVIGYAYLSTFNPRSAYQHTADLSIYLKSEIQSKGIGRLMCEVLFEIAKLQNIVQIVSLVTAENIISAKFHQKLGFECQGRLKNVGYKQDKWLDVSFYIKNIQPLHHPQPLIPYPQLDKEKVQKILDEYNQKINCTNNI